MSTVINIHSDELDEHFIQAIKEMFHHKKLEIAIQEVEYQNDTDYLNSSPANREFLLKSIKSFENGEPRIYVDLDTLEKL